MTTTTIEACAGGRGSRATTFDPTVLITGASTGVGAAHVERFAGRGHDLVLAARDTGRSEALADRPRGDADVAIDILPADLANLRERAAIETRLREEPRIGILVNNAGAGLAGRFVEQSTDDIDGLVALNTTALVRLAHATAPRSARSGGGAIVNIGSVVGPAPQIGMPIHGATEAFVQYLSQALNHQLGPQGVPVQAVLPSATRTESCRLSGVDVATLPDLLEGGELVDAIVSHRVV